MSMSLRKLKKGGILAQAPPLCSQGNLSINNSEKIITDLLQIVINDHVKIGTHGFDCVCFTGFHLNLCFMAFGLTILTISFTFSNRFD